MVNCAHHCRSFWSKRATLAGALLRALQQSPGVETHLVVSKGALRILELESPQEKEAFLALADQVHPIGDIAANIASGSFLTAGMW
jgi:3-polyprenyl-4-hydroxybenzoate decarboxylase